MHKMTNSTRSTTYKDNTRLHEKKANGRVFRVP